MSVSLGDLVWWIRGKSDKLPGDLKESEGQVKTFGQKVSNTLKDQMNIAVGVFMSQGMMQLSGALQKFTKNLVNSTVEYSNQMQDLALQTGMTLEDSSRLYNMADDLRIGYGDLSIALKLYGQYLDKTGSSEQASIESLAKLSEQYLALAPGVDRLTFLTERFGARSGVEMAKLLSLGTQAILDMAAGVSENLIVTEESAKKTEAYRLALDNLQDSMKGAGMTLGLLLLPYLTDLTNWLTANGIPTLEGYIDTFKGLPEPVQQVVIAVAALVIVLGMLSPQIIALTGLFNLLKPVISAVFGKWLTGAIAATAVALGVSTGLVWALIAALAVLFALMVKAGGWKEFWAQIGTTLKQLYFILNDMAKKAFSYAKNIGASIVRGIGQGIVDGWNWLIALVTQVTQKLLAGAKKALLISSPSKAFADQIGKPSIEGIGKGFRDGLQKVVGDMQATVSVLPAGALAGGGIGGGAISVGHVEYHGSFSENERNMFDKRSKDIAGDTLTRSIKRRG